VEGEEVKGPLSILYSTANPVTGDTAGSTKAVAQVLGGAAITGDGG
jgi:hypothetical protein